MLDDKIGKSFTLDKAVLRELEELKHERNINMSAFVNSAIREKLKELKEVENV